MKERLQELERATGHTFSDAKYLEIAVTHSSFANERGKGAQSNERQEFLGDAVLSIVASDYLFKRFRMAEGDLTKLRASLVCEKSLSGFAGEIDLGGYLLLGKGEAMTGGAKRPSILADAFESVIAAIYLDGGFEAAARFVIPFIERALEGELAAGFRDYKTELQEIVQRKPDENVHYVLVEESGPDHDKRFEVEALLHSNVLGRGIGRSKKSAEQAAAKEVLRLMGEL